MAFSETKDILNQLKEKLVEDQIMKSLGLPGSLLRNETIWKRNAVYLGLKGLIRRLLDDNNMAECKPISTPMNDGTDARDDNENVLNDRVASTYRSNVGSLLYIAIKIRPDLSVAASSLGSCGERPCGYYMVAAKQVLRCLKRPLER